MSRFSAVEPIPGKSFWDILKWHFTADRARWPSRVDYGPTAKPASAVEGNALCITFVNHSTVLIQTQGLNILTDPVWSKRVSPFSFMGPKRINPPGVAWDDLPKIDLVLISHSHYDHLEMATVKKLTKRDDPLFIVPTGVEAILRKQVPPARTHILGWHESFGFQNGVDIIGVPSQHWSARSLRDRNRTLWSGYIVKTPGGNLYFAGDTGYGSGKVFQDIHTRYGAMRLALLPIGAYEPRWFMKDSHANPEEAVYIFQDVHAENAVAIHWGTFQLTDEAHDAPPAALERALKKAGISLEKFRALKPGQSWLVA